MKLHIADMLRAQTVPHLSFHTPGHKRAGGDITELSYSDCLLSPHGAIAEAERDIAGLLGAAESLILTDGSTCGVFSMIASLKAAGLRAAAGSVFSHPSVFHACELLGIRFVPIPVRVSCGIPLQPSAEEAAEALREADALIVTSPDYYGFFPSLAELKALCNGAGKPLLIDGAHGSHLHFDAARYAGTYADLWVDGAHKSLPAMTQGAVVSAKEEGWGKLLREQTSKLRTTSPSYPIMASVEYAIKYPRNEALERAAERFKGDHVCVRNPDWSKLLVSFEDCAAAQKALEAAGVYPEFNDGNYLMFYLSPCTEEGDLMRLGELLAPLARRAVPEDAPAGGIPMYTEKT